MLAKIYPANVIFLPTMHGPGESYLRRMKKQELNRNQRFVNKPRQGILLPIQV